MHCEEEIAKGLYWIGGDDRRLGIFEGGLPVPDGMSYNNYLLLDDKTVLLDTIDRAVEERFFETVNYLLDGRPLDYIIVQHMEPDHSASLKQMATMHPEATLVCTRLCKTLIGQFFGEELEARAQVVTEGDSLETGTHTLAFATAPMVHWPEVMVTYDVQDKILFSADAFGSFGALDGCLYDDLWDYDSLLPEMRRYYTNIVGKYGTQVTELLDKAATLDIETICPLHGPILREYIPEIVEAYKHWASYEPEDQGVVIAYASVYGGTRDVAEKLAFKLSDLGIHDLALFDLSVTDPSYVLSEAFRVSNIVLASVTYNAGMFPAMESTLAEFTTHNLRSRKFSIIQNGSWGPNAGRLIKEELDKIPGTQYVGEMFTIKSRMRDDQDAELEALAEAIAESVKNPTAPIEVKLGEVEEEAKPAPIVGAVRPVKLSAPPTVAPAVNPVAPSGIPATPGGIPFAPGFKPTATAAPAPKPVEAVQQPKTKIIQIWRCTFCGYQVEIEKGKEDMTKFQCPICLRVGEFMLVREKEVPIA